jgi:hypothetical protein
MDFEGSGLFVVDDDDDDFVFNYFFWAGGTAAIMYFFGILMGMGEPRVKSVFDQRLEWGKFIKRHGKRQFFKRHLRMKPKSFNKLLSYIKDDIQPDEAMADLRGGAIIPEVRLYCTLRWLAGGSYSDILIQAGISKSSFYRIIWETIRAIATSKHEALQIRFPQTKEECKLAAAGFQSISHKGVINNCVSVVDGFLLGIQTPAKSQVANVRSFFSGHYKCSGLNIQAASDHHCRFTYIALAGPGVMGDSDAIKECKLGELVENLPQGFVVIGDAAYIPSEHMASIYFGVDKKKPLYDNFNFFASQCRIRIEMAFGLMTKKWGILQRNLTTKLDNDKWLILAIARLHNFSINERLRPGQRTPYSDGNMRAAIKLVRRSHQSPEGSGSVRYKGNSAIRLLMAHRVRDMKLTRPAKNKIVSD